MRFFGAAAFFTACAALAGCNLIFGIEAGELLDTSSTSTTSTTSTSSGTGGAGGTGGTGGAGGVPQNCPLEKVPPCQAADGGTGPFCSPVLLTSGYDGYAIGLALVGDHLHYADGAGHIVRIRFDGAVDSVFGMGSDSPFVVSDGDNVYWTDWYDPMIRGATLDPTHTLFKVTSMVDGANSPLGRMAVHAGLVYWAAQGPNAVWAAKTDGSAPFATKVADKLDDVNQTDVSVGVAVDDAHVYWSDAGKVLRIPVDQIGDAQAIEDFVLAPGAGEITLDSERVYFTTDNGVWSVRKDTTDLVQIPSPGDRARGLLLDGGHVYWTTMTGVIARAQRGQGMETVETVTQGAPEAFQLAADCGAIYWSTFNFNHGHVYKVRKPE
jgi:hypothetical protein